MGFGLGRPAGPLLRGAWVLGGRAETAGADRQPRPRPGWRGGGGGEGKEVHVGGCIYSPGAGAETQSGLSAGK